MSEEKPIHLTQEVIEQFAQEMRVEPEDYQRLLDTFISCNEDRLKTLTQALSKKDADVARNAVHSIKGTASTMRISWMASIAARMEMELREGNCSGHDADLDTLRRGLETVRNDALEYARIVSKEE